MSLSISDNVVSATGRPQRISNPVLATLIFVCSEVMFFAALVSAYVIIKASSGVAFAPPAHITLPVAVTGLNMVVLCVSGLLLHLSTNRFAVNRQHAEILFGLSIICGSVFVIGQGYEWIKLLSYGMKMTSGIFAACFFLLIGAHALHAASTVLVMLYFYLRRHQLKLESLKAMRIFWLFVVFVFPILYWLVYF